MGVDVRLQTDGSDCRDRVALSRRAIVHRAGNARPVMVPGVLTATQSRHSAEDLPVAVIHHEPTAEDWVSPLTAFALTATHR